MINDNGRDDFKKTLILLIRDILPDLEEFPEMYGCLNELREVYSSLFELEIKDDTIIMQLRHHLVRCKSIMLTLYTLYPSCNFFDAVFRRLDSILQILDTCVSD